MSESWEVVRGLKDWVVLEREGNELPNRLETAQLTADYLNALERRLAAAEDAVKDFGLDLINAATKIKAAEDALREKEREVEVLTRARRFQDELIEEHMKACAMPNRAALAQEQQA